MFKRNAFCVAAALSYLVPLTGGRTLTERLSHQNILTRMLWAGFTFTGFLCFEESNIPRSSMSSHVYKCTKSKQKKIFKTFFFLKLLWTLWIEDYSKTGSCGVQIVRRCMVQLWKKKVEGCKDEKVWQNKKKAVGWARMNVNQTETNQYFADVSFIRDDEKPQGKKKKELNTKMALSWEILLFLGVPSIGGIDF